VDEANSKQLTANGQSKTEYSAVICWAVYRLLSAVCFVHDSRKKERHDKRSFLQTKLKRSERTLSARRWRRGRRGRSGRRRLHVNVDLLRAAASKQPSSKSEQNHHHDNHEDYQNRDDACAAATTITIISHVQPPVVGVKDTNY
jgi:hypothetical protein